MYRSFRLYEDGSLYAEIEPWIVPRTRGADSAAVEGSQANGQHSLHGSVAGAGAADDIRRAILQQQQEASYPVNNTMQWPNSAVVQMYFTNGASQQEGCSGTWVSGYDILTAAHCLVNWTQQQPRAAYKDFYVRCMLTPPNG